MAHITKADLLEVIAEPYQEAFTPENVRKAFEVTGTWPVDRSKITPEKIAPSKGLSLKAGPMIEPTSPVKKVLNLFQDLLQPSRPRPAGLAQLIEGHPQITPPTSPTPSELLDLHSHILHVDNLGGLLHSSTTFLFDGLKPHSSNALPSLNMPVFPHSLSHGLPLLSSKSPNHLPDPRNTTPLHQPPEYEEVVKYAIGLEADISALQANMTLLTLQNQQLQVGLRTREVKRETARRHLFPGGRGVEATGDKFMGTLETIEDEKEAASRQKNNRKEERVANAQQKQADKAVRDDRRVQWGLAMEKWEKKRANLRKGGLPMNRAGKKPCLKDFKVGTVEDGGGNALEEGTQAPGPSIQPRRAIRRRQILHSSEEELSDNLDYDNLDSD